MKSLVGSTQGIKTQQIPSCLRGSDSSFPVTAADPNKEFHVYIWQERFSSPNNDHRVTIRQF